MSMQFGDMLPNFPFIQAVGPEDLNTAANPGIYCSLADYDHAIIIISIGDLAGGTAAVTLYQATALAGTGAKALAFSKYYQKGQKLLISAQSGTFSVGETITGGTSAATGYLVKISSTHLYLCPLGTTTWTTGETLTGGTSAATATLTGTGQDEDIWLARTATSDTFSTLASTFKTYAIPVAKDMLDAANDYDCFRVHIAQAGVSETQGSAFYLLFGGPIKYPAISAIDTLKVS